MDTLSTVFDTTKQVIDSAVSTVTDTVATAVDTVATSTVVTDTVAAVAEVASSTEKATLVSLVKELSGSLSNTEATMHFPMIFAIAGGLAIFLLGMNYMSSGLQTVAGMERLKVVLAGQLGNGVRRHGPWLHLIVLELRRLIAVGRR